MAVAIITIARYLPCVRRNAFKVRSHTPLHAAIAAQPVGRFSKPSLRTPTATNGLVSTSDFGSRRLARIVACRAKQAPSHDPATSEVFLSKFSDYRFTAVSTV